MRSIKHPQRPRNKAYTGRMARFAGILFDNDGTLVDTHDLILSSFTYATKQVLGHALPEEQLMARVGTPLVKQMADFTDDPATQQELLRVYRDHNHRHHDEQVKAFSGVAECLAALQERGVRMGVVTSKMHALAWRGLQVTGLSGFFECLVGADDCELYKPDPAPVSLGCDLLELAPAACLYVGDSPFDIQAGSAAGCATAAVLWGMFDRDALAAESPDFIASVPSDLVDFLG